MNSYKNIRIDLFFVLIALFSQLNAQIQESDRLDLMVDFGYPVSTMQSVRQDLSQTVYFLQQHDYSSDSSISSSVISTLENALSKMSSRQVIESDDRDFIQEMIDQINALIEKLEASDRTMIFDVCQQLQGRL